MAIYDINGNLLNSAYDVEGTQLSTAYDLGGNIIWSGAVVDYSDYSISNYCAVSLSPMQGFDIYNGVIFQFIANNSNISNRMTTVDVSTSSIINSGISATSGHGDVATFSKQRYIPTDTYPMIYVSADTNPTNIYLNRVTTSSSELIKTFYFPTIAQTGYYTGHAYDEDNQIMYILGYTEPIYNSDDGGNNKVIVSKWDMSDLTDNGDDTYTPAFISSYERPFIYVMQGQQWHDGMIWVASGGTNVRGYVYALDPSDGTVLYTVDTGTNTELEGVAFISNTEMVLGLQGGTYKKVTFATN